MPKDRPYKPVSCGFHSEFELLIMHHSRVKLSWCDEQEVKHSAIVKPIDIQTRAGEEFLHVTDEKNRQLQIRLDRIQSYSEV